MVQRDFHFIINIVPVHYMVFVVTAITVLTKIPIHCNAFSVFLASSVFAVVELISSALFCSDIFLWQLFTAQRSAIARYNIMLSSCGRPSVISWSSTKMAKPRITQTTPYDNPGAPVFWCQNIGEIPTRSPQRGRQIEVGQVQISDFRPISRYLRNGAR